MAVSLYCRTLWRTLIASCRVIFIYDLGMFDYSCRVAGNYYIIGDVVGDDRTGSDDDAVADSHARTDNHSATEPAVIADTDRESRLYRLTPFDIIVRMVGGQELAVGTDECVCADGDTSAVEKDAVEIDKRTLADGNPVAVVAMEWRTNDYRGMRIGDEGFDTTM